MHYSHRTLHYNTANYFFILSLEAEAEYPGSSAVTYIYTIGRAKLNLERLEHLVIGEDHPPMITRPRGFHSTVRSPVLT